MSPTLRYASLSGYLAVCQAVGLDPDPLMRGVDLEPADLASPEKWVPAPRVARLLELSARACGEEDFGLRLAEHRRLEALGPLSLVLRDEPTLRSALDLLIRYEHAYNEAIRMRLSDVNGLATLRLWFEMGEPTPSRQGEELAVAVLHGVIRKFLGPTWQPLSVCFTHAAPQKLDTHIRVLGPRLQFGHSFTGLILYGRDLDAPSRIEGRFHRRDNVVAAVQRLRRTDGPASACLHRRLFGIPAERVHDFGCHAQKQA